MIWNKQVMSETTPATPADEMTEIIQAFRRAAALVSKRESDRSRVEVQDAKALIEAARRWMRETGVGDAACRIFEASRPWHAWAKRDDWTKWNLLGVVDVEGGGSVVDTTHSAFRRGDRKWRFEHTRQKSYMPADDQSRGTLAVAVDDVEILKLAVAKSFDDGSTWRVVDVLALDRGEWAAELVEMDVALDQAQKRRQAGSEAARLREQASKLRL